MVGLVYGLWGLCELFLRILTDSRKARVAGLRLRARRPPAARGAAPGPC